MQGDAGKAVAAQVGDGTVGHDYFIRRSVGETRVGIACRLAAEYRGEYLAVEGYLAGAGLHLLVECEYDITIGRSVVGALCRSRRQQLRSRKVVDVYLVGIYKDIGQVEALGVAGR